MFLCLFINFSLAEQMRLFKMLSGKKQFIEFHGEISPFLFLRYAFVADLISYCADAELKIALNEVLD